MFTYSDFKSILRITVWHEKTHFIIVRFQEKQYNQKLKLFNLEKMFYGKENKCILGSYTNDGLVL